MFEFVAVVPEIPVTLCDVVPEIPVTLSDVSSEFIDQVVVATSSETDPPVTPRSHVHGEEANCAFESPPALQVKNTGGESLVLRPSIIYRRKRKHLTVQTVGPLMKRVKVKGRRPPSEFTSVAVAGADGVFRCVDCKLHRSLCFCVVHDFKR